jgi:hypothetical protein
MSLSRSRSHNGPTNPWNNLQTIPKQKRNSRSKGLSNSAQPGADSPRCPGGRSARMRRTIRKRTLNNQYWTSKYERFIPYPQTIRDLQADGPPNLLQPKTLGSMHRNEENQEHAKNTMNNWLVGALRIVRTVSADSPPSSQTAKPSPTSWRSTPPSLYPICQINQGIATKS